MSMPRQFPYFHSGEPDLPAYLRMRAEGIPLRQAVWSGLSYVRKYLRPKRTAPVEEIRYFDQQRQLLQHLMHAPEVSGQNSRLAVVGDLMWVRNGWDTFLTPGVLAYLNAHEVVLGNLESPISNRFPVPTLWPDYFAYNSPPDLITSFCRPDGTSTFSALSTANNHCLDCGDDGLAETLDFLDGQKIAHAGVRKGRTDTPYTLFQAAGSTFGFYAGCWGLNNPDQIRASRHQIEVVPGLVPRIQHPVDITRIRSALAEMAAAGADFRIVYLHWGYEFEFYPCPDVMQLAREIVCAGADLVVGSHPHVLQPFEVCFVNGAEKRLLAGGLDLPALHAETGCLVDDGTGIPRKALVVYSLGNFTTAMFTLACQIGMVLSLSLRRDQETGKLDWDHPEVQLVYNVQRDPGTHLRRLVLLETYLRERERAGDHAAPVRTMAEFLEHHLLGPA